MKISIVPLGKLCEMDRQGLRSNDPIAQKLPFVGVENVAAGTGIIDFDSNSRIGTQKSTMFRFDQRHVLYGKLRPYLNKVAVPDFAGRCSTELVPLLPKEGIDRFFLAHILMRKETVDFVMASVTGSRMPRTDMKTMLSMPVPLPPLDEQRRIVNILNRAAKIERLRSQAEELLQEFTPALFHKMFGEPAENPVLDQHAGGDDDGMKTTVPLGELATSIESGFACGKSNLVEQGLLHIRPFNIGKNGDLDLTLKYQIPSDVVPSSKAILCSGDILFNNTNSRDLVGKCAVVRKEIEAGFSNHVTRIRVDPDCCEPIFVAAYMQYLWSQGYFRDHCTQWVSQAAFGNRFLTRLKIPLPPLNEQQKFAKIVKSAQTTSELANTGSRTASELTASLMSRLLETNA